MTRWLQIMADHRRRLITSGSLTVERSSNYPGHEERLQDHMARVLSYFKARPFAAGADPVLGGLAGRRGPHETLRRTPRPAG